MTTCETYSCAREEQCDNCFMVDHLKECKGCEQYDHPPMTRRLEVNHDSGERRFYNFFKAAVLPEVDISRIEFIADQEQKWGEPLSANDL